MILLSHPTGNANVRHAALALLRADLLGEFWTCVNYRETPLLRRVLPAALARQLRRRAFPVELHRAIRSSPLRELGRLLAPRAGLRSLVRHEHGPLSVDAVYRALDRQVAKRLADERFTAVYAYEDGALESFRAASRHGRRRFYDLPIGHWRTARRILAEEAEREPEWASTLTGNADSAEKTARKDAELQLADVVLVASSFTRRTLEQAGVSTPVVTIPYGAPVPPPVAARPAGPAAGRLRVLFVGSLGQRKGLSYLFRAVRPLRPAVELTLIGAAPLRRCLALERELAQVRWIPTCSHREVLAHMAAHDVLVLPSLFEGFGLVLLEAMAAGLPVITTPHTAGPDILTDGVEGFIVPIRSADAISSRLEMLRRDPARRAHMAEAARRRAAACTWEDYERSLAACVSTALARV